MTNITLNRDEYLDKVSACWLGKNIGGTLGMPVEWHRQVNNLSFYLQDLTGDPVPNDDLDLQLVWLTALENHGVDIDAHTLADYWLLYVTPHYAEYGTGKANLRRGLLPPLSGSVENELKDSCGAFIRTEIWACIAPGLPAVAAKYAYEDAIVDHGDGEGTFAAVMIAAMQSAAFVVSDLRTLIDIGLSYIPEDCGTAEAVKMTVRLVDEGKKWRTIRDEILRHHRGLAWFGCRSHISDDDFKKGFFDGKLGFDVPSNIAILILGLLVGGDDFDKMICTTVNCGEDTDCTAATAGALWGILRGQAGIPERWIAPIGRGITTLCVNNAEIDPGIPQTVDELTRRTARIAQQVLSRHKAETMLSDGETRLHGLDAASLMCPDGGEELFTALQGPRFTFPLFTVRTEYPDGPFVRDDEPTRLRVLIDNLSRVPATLMFRWCCPEGGCVAPGGESTTICQQRQYRRPAVMDFQLSCQNTRQATNRFVLEITAVNRATVMEIPVVLIQKA
ncbi:MAG: ADP-ribosylglycohydrolase family protein [Phycisphaerae bacterium]|nr:ADP-ribosylglycohydrolase family protein [Phycisphaerae bacterium]